MTIENYKESIGKYFQANTSSKKLEENLNDSQARIGLAQSLDLEPHYFAGLNADIIDQYLKNDLTPKIPEFKNNLVNKTDENLETILSEIETNAETDNLIGYILSNKAVDYETDQEITELHKKVENAQEILETKDIGKAVEELHEKFNISQETLAYHARAIPEGLLKSFGRLVSMYTEKLVGKLREENKAKNYFEHLVKNTEDKENSYINLANLYSRIQVQQPEQEEVTEQEQPES